MMPDELKQAAPLGRCWWCGDDPLYVAYHDEEWGTPLHDERGLFELLMLEGFQAGLSWITVLRKRPAFRQCFDGFEPARVAAFTDQDVVRLLAEPGIIRNRGKIQATIGNARAWLQLSQECGSVDQFLWSFTGRRTLREPGEWTREKVRSTSPEAEAMSLALRKRGFRFVGPTICYAFMQASGMVDDHVQGCWRYIPRPSQA